MIDSDTNIGAKKFDGRAFAAAKLERIRAQVLDWQQTHLIGLTMVSIYPPEDEASVLYTKLKKKDAAAVGISYVTKPISLKATRHEWLKAVMEVNQDKKVQALLVQKPSALVYEKITTGKGEEFSTWWNNIAEALEPRKDVDCLAPWSLFLLEKEAECVVEKKHEAHTNLGDWVLPATAQAVIDIALDAVGSVEELRKKKIVVIGRSVIVGRPAAAGFRVLGAETELISSKSDLAKVLPSADIVVTATGVADLIAADWIKEGSVLIDVGAPKPEFQIACYDKASFYTPVPYGVGPVTRACLLENVFKLPTLAEYAVFR
jgi:methylenetetrahydrofolate dehydrogenase (NADP+)/methenyltetrahydrofolate cyclohydrolase